MTDSCSYAYLDRSVADFIKEAQHDLAESVCAVLIGRLMLEAVLSGSSDSHDGSEKSEKEKKARQRKIDRIFWKG